MLGDSFLILSAVRSWFCKLRGIPEASKVLDTLNQRRCSPFTMMQGTKNWALENNTRIYRHHPQ